MVNATILADLLRFQKSTIFGPSVNVGSLAENNSGNMAWSELYDLAWPELSLRSWVIESG